MSSSPRNSTTKNDSSKWYSKKKRAWNLALHLRGHRFANTRLRAQFGGTGWVNDQTGGIGYLFALRELANDIDKKWPKVLKKLEDMRDALINSKTMLCNVTLDSTNIGRSCSPHLENFIFATARERRSTFNLQHSIRD
jgi:Zn-dependent M16 (insulinase) family peptidase